ncbi:type II secretion system protein GspN [Nannocystaceae bacterium ST9]
MPLRPTGSDLPPAGGPSASMSGFASRSGISLRDLWPKLRRGLLWAFALTIVFLVSAWISLPTRSIAWRIAHEARLKGLNITVEDVSIRPWGSATLHEVVWNFAPSRPDSNPVPFVVEELDISFSVLGYLLFDEIDVEFEGTLDEGTIAGGYFKGEDEARFKVDIADLPVYGVPKLQDAVSAPVRGIFGLSIDLTMPGGKWSEANGRMEVHCYSCTIGDGESKLFVPGTKKTSMLSKGVTIPEIDLGTLDGVLVVEDGKAVAEEFGNESEDIRIKIGGDITFKDPVGSSQLNLLIKVFVSPTLRSRSDQLDLMVATASDKVKMDPPDDGWLGFYLEGNFKNRRFRGIKSKTKAEALRDKREAREKRKKDAEAKRAKAKADREAAKAAAEAAKAEAAGGETGEETSGAAAEGETTGEDPTATGDRPQIPPEAGIMVAEPVAENAEEGGVGGEGGDEVGEAPPTAEEGGEVPVEEQPAVDPSEAPQ